MVTARNALLTYTLEKRKTADTAAALELYNEGFVGDCVWCFACRAAQSPRIAIDAARQVRTRLRSKLSINFARGSIAKEIEETIVTRYPKLPKVVATEFARYIAKKIVGGNAPLSFSIVNGRELLNRHHNEKRVECLDLLLN